jgi:hypothetical protein
MVSRDGLPHNTSVRWATVLWRIQFIAPISSILPSRRYKYLFPNISNIFRANYGRNLFAACFLLFCLSPAGPLLLVLPLIREVRFYEAAQAQLLTPGFRKRIFMSFSRGDSAAAMQPDYVNARHVANFLCCFLCAAAILRVVVLSS